MKQTQKRVSNQPGRWGTETQGTHSREGEAGHNALLERNTGGTQMPPTVSTKLQQIAERAVKYPDEPLKNLAHLIDVDFLREAYYQLNPSSSPGIDGETWAGYGLNLEANLADLCERMKNMTYRAQPVVRVWIDKEDGKKRPIGKLVLEDKIAQRAVVMILEAIYEQEFYDFSDGFRPGRSAHDALSELRAQCMGMNINWILDADVSGCFDSIDHDLLMEFLERRVKDKNILRLIGKWLNAGVLEGGQLSDPERGTPQGGVISPILANIFLHNVLDEWFEKVVRPRMRGQCFIERFADDFVLGFELTSDAQRVMGVLPKRFTKYELTIHPDKTKLIPFGKQHTRDEDGSGNETFDFLGFTHYWARSRRGYWVIKRRTARKRQSRAQKNIWQWCKKNRHLPLKEQYTKLCSKLLGHYAYYGIRCNIKSLRSVYEYVRRAWHYWLGRRSTRSHIRWEKFAAFLERWVLPMPRIVHSI